MTHIKRTRFDQSGVMLIEALVAVLIFSIGILALIGLQAAMIASSSEAKYRSEASFIAQNRIGEIWADPANAVNYVEEDADISTMLPGATRTTAQISPGEFMVTVTWQPPSDLDGVVVRQYSAVARILGGV